jgi:hypothetical protein
VGGRHYRNCVDTAKATGASDDFVDRALHHERGATVRERIAGCSRLR